MKVPKTFVPERDLENTIQDYLEREIVDNSQVYHEDPNLTYILSVLAILSRFSVPTNLSHTEVMNLAKKGFAADRKGLNKKDIKKAIELLKEISNKDKKKCLHSNNLFKALHEIISDYSTGREKEEYLTNLEQAKELYSKKIKEDVTKAFLDDYLAIKNGVMDYVNMIIGLDSETLGKSKEWRFIDPKIGTPKTIVIDKKYIYSVEESVGLKTNGQKETYRATIRKIYGQQITTDPRYDFMDNLELVRAVTNVRLKDQSPFLESLSRSNKENIRSYHKVLRNLKKAGYCGVCAEKAIEHFCSQKS